MKYILYRVPYGLDKNVRQHELVAVEYRKSIFDVADSFIQAAADDLAGSCLSMQVVIWYFYITLNQLFKLSP